MKPSTLDPDEREPGNGQIATALSDPAVDDAPERQDLERHLGRMAGALPSDGGNLRTLFGLLTSAKQAGDGSGAGQLHRAEARYRALVEQIPAVTFMTPLDGSTSELYVSPQIEELLGFSAQEWLDDPFLWYRQLHPDDQARWTESFAQTCFCGERFRAEFRFLSRDGRVVWVHGEAKLVMDRHGAPSFLRGVAFDITERKRAEEATLAAYARMASNSNGVIACASIPSAGPRSWTWRWRERSPPSNRILRSAFISALCWTMIPDGTSASWASQATVSISAPKKSSCWRLTRVRTNPPDA
jgi:PAS domain S-box-containing protein